MADDEELSKSPLDDVSFSLLAELEFEPKTERLVWWPTNGQLYGLL